MIVHCAKSMCFVSSIYLHVSAVFITKQKSLRWSKTSKRKRTFEFVESIGTKHQLNTHRLSTVSDKNCWDTLTKRCFFPSRAPLVALKVVYRSSVTKSFTPTLRGQGDPKVSQPFWLTLYFRGILGMWLLVGPSGGKSLGRYMHVSEPFFREKH